ncbi:hypothetical protein KUW15_11785 [Qipengyuania aquimaris]|uniref:hypothetical protein n=1 Tax=Qipengyuania aquimaris TaxID=255984 RepID=UPI001C97C960|nr:hypothetical protein [Qipengyuania aquimaris]MBY6129399.1 hypothetical protein [Qipengyuania aquimaris]
MRPLKHASLLVLSLLAVPAMAQDDAETGTEAGPAIGTEVFVSTDSDDTTVWRVAGDFDLRNAPDGSRLGVRVEKAWYDPQGQGRIARERVFLQVADGKGDVEWSVRIGTDGDTVIGSASINDNEDFRKEAFIERDIVETPLGLERGIYSTFAGAAIDLPADENNIFTVLGGVQEFTGDNLRLHLRGNFVHVVDSELGLSAQLRTRYFHSTEPGEFDYFSPENYTQVLPVVQLRRFVNDWQLLAAGGIGAQKSTGTGWEQANFAQFRFISAAENDWFASGEAIYSQTPGDNAVAGSGYDYFQARFSLTRRF